MSKVGDQIADLGRGLDQAVKSADKLARSVRRVRRPRGPAVAAQAGSAQVLEALRRVEKRLPVDSFQLMARRLNL